MDDINWNNIINDALTRANDPDTTTMNVLDTWANPMVVQQNEFGQQIAAQMMQNEWNSEGSRLQRMKDAGINANVAAAGIAGAGASPSVSAPNSSIGAGAQGVGAAAQMLGSAASALDAGATATEKLSLLGVEKDRRKAEIRNLLSSALHNDWLAYSISEMLPLQKENERADTYLKLANYEKAKVEKLLIIKRVDEAQAHIDELTSQAQLYRKQGNLVDAQVLETQARTEQIGLQNDKLQWDKDWRDTYKYDPNAPVDVALEQAMVNGADDSVVNAIGDSVKSVSYNERKGYNTAEVEDAFDKAYNDGLGNEAASAEYSKMKYEVDIAKLAVKYYLEALAAGAKDPASFVIQKLMVPSLKEQSEIYEGNVRKPTPKPIVRD